MELPGTLEPLDREELIRLIYKLADRNKALEAEVAELRRRNARSAAPFSKNKPKPNPKKPGRKAGEGTYKHREAPEPTEPEEKAPVSEKECDQCGGKLEPDGTETVTRTYLPRPEAMVKSYEVEICRCVECGRRVRGKHAEVCDDQTGATAHRVDESVYAMAHVLHYGFGIPVRKTARLMDVAFGIAITQGALTQDALRRARRCLAEIYEQIRQEVSQSEVVYTDDTGWRINGATAFLMGFDTDDATYYQIRPRHRHQEVLEVVGEDFRGVLSTDRGVSYDAKALEDIPMNKCAAHVLRNVKELVESQHPAAQTVGCEIAWIFREAIRLWDNLQAGRIGQAAYKRRGNKLYRQLGRALRARKLTDRGNRTMIKELAVHYQRGNLLRFLKDPGIEPTNNRAERALRPAVVQRKVSHCSKNDAGADATSKFTTVIRTCGKRGHQAVEALTAAFRKVNPFAEPIPP